MGKQMHLKKKKIGIFLIFTILGLSFQTLLPPVAVALHALEFELDKNPIKDYQHRCFGTQRIGLPATRRSDMRSLVPFFFRIYNGKRLN